MTKYQPELKVQIVHEYLTTSKSLSDLGEKYHISYKLISEWVNRYRLQGIDAFRHRKSRRFFSVDFKLRMIDYYQTHEESMASVVAKFDLLPHQISAWRFQFQTGRIEALKQQPQTNTSDLGNQLIQAFKNIKADQGKERSYMMLTKEEQAEIRLESAKMLIPMVPLEKRWEAALKVFGEDAEKAKAFLEENNIEY
ncbi:helix-turn-helix domain-containing protein [Ligilactobacillus saerimneri]|uniref:helix-turn-helix domain-containing protein n=1 Tax=Ligilactobacillus saerimneri TaxID=228229 RepID=UPI001DC70A79|nr:helix-turn-helix domain-containing protein [Ligilactobacillus saerimneri]